MSHSEGHLTEECTALECQAENMKAIWNSQMSEGCKKLKTTQCMNILVEVAVKKQLEEKPAKKCKSLPVTVQAPDHEQEGHHSAAPMESSSSFDDSVSDS